MWVPCLFILGMTLKFLLLLLCAYSQEQLKVLEVASKGEGDHLRDEKNEETFPSVSQHNGEGQESNKDNFVANGDQGIPVAHVVPNHNDALEVVHSIPRPCHVHLDTQAHEDTKAGNVDLQVEQDQPVGGLKEGKVGNWGQGNKYNEGEVVTWRQRNTYGMIEVLLVLTRPMHCRLQFIHGNLLLRNMVVQKDVLVASGFTCHTVAWPRKVTMMGWAINVQHWFQRWQRAPLKGPGDDQLPTGTGSGGINSVRNLVVAALVEATKVEPDFTNVWIDPDSL
ncbi:hypothetical protein PAXRUDRAFT_27536 [Paxillus rubicundulus Ve08.2h10]|uniref:Uncharacterized protein n=1 Tax=Paxillus rubicundulus Ve08.2h10 TaxID=930991 RepID=A0A0D0D4B2_9AGAM|nr:hypothetical protein PAXRUDRAFT_27536 [Paxillus rubicundulus Ve08.2h10]